jgi:ankyrin repeat protein
LIAAGAFVNQMGSHHMTALFVAAKEGYTAIVMLLLANVAYTDADADGCTALCIAVENGHVEIVQRLIVAGASVLGPHMKVSLIAAHRNRRGRTNAALYRQYGAIIKIIEIATRDQKRAAEEDAAKEEAARKAAEAAEAEAAAK